MPTPRSGARTPIVLTPTNNAGPAPAKGLPAQALDDFYAAAGTSEESESEEEGEEVDQRKGAKRNRFGIAFQEVIEETGARVKVDSFDHCVVEVRKEDLSGFLEQLSLKAIVG